MANLWTSEQRFYFSFLVKDQCQHYTLPLTLVSNKQTDQRQCICDPAFGGDDVCHDCQALQFTLSTTPQIPLLFTMADTRACTLKGKQEGALSDLIMDSQGFLSTAAQLLSTRKLMRGACEMRADFSIRKFACDLNERLFALRSSALL